MEKITYEIFDKAKIKKEFYKKGIKYLKLQHTDKENNKIYLIKISYKRYVLQKHLGYLISDSYKVIQINNDLENFNLGNLVIRNCHNQSPIAFKYDVIKVNPNRKFKTIIVKSIDSFKTKEIGYDKYNLELYLGRETLQHEKIKFKNNDKEDITPKNLIITTYEKFSTKLYRNVRRINGPYYLKSNNYRKYIIITFNDSSKKPILLSRFIVQEHLERFLTADETVHHIDGDYFNDELLNLEVLTRFDHNTQDTFRLTPLNLICQTCGKNFIIEGKQLCSAYRHKRQNKNYIGPFCSYSCSKHLNQYNNKGYKCLLPDKKEYFYVNSSGDKIG